MLRAFLRQRRDWITFLAAFLVGAVLSSAIVWAIMTGRDPLVVVGDALTAVTVVAAVVALRYARESARAAEATVTPMQDMATRLAATVDTLKNIEASQDATADTMQANLQLAQQIRAEESRVATLERYQRVQSLHYQLQSAQEAYKASKQTSREAVIEREHRLRTLLQEFRGAVAFLDKDAFQGAWEEAYNIGFHDPQGLINATGKALADVEKAILELQQKGSNSD